MRLKDYLRNIYLHVRRIFLTPFLSLRRMETLEGKEVRAILALRHDRIGDMVLSTGFFKILKEKYPDARLLVLASERNRDILLNNPYVDEILVYDGLVRFFGYFRKKKIDLAVDLFYTYELRQAFLAFISGAKYRVGFYESGREIFFNLKGPGMRSSASMAGHLAQLLSFLGARPDGYQPAIYLRDDEIQWAKDLLLSKGISENDLKIGVHPGGYYPAQRWPYDNFILVAQGAARRYKAKVLFFGEVPSDESVFSMTGLSLRHLAALLSQCRVLVCNNSGPMHMAAALGVATVSTMGPTDPVLWQPFGSGHIVIKKDRGMGLISVDDMMGALDRQLST